MCIRDRSGLIDGFGSGKKQDGTKIVQALLEELGFGSDEVEMLETVPYSTLAEAYNKVSPALAKQGEYIGGNPIPNEFYVGDPRAVSYTHLDVYKRQWLYSSQAVDVLPAFWKV